MESSLASASPGGADGGLLRRVYAIAGVVFVLWAALGFFTPLTNGDIWTNLRLGEDLLSGQGLPAVERYSAGAEGRPFVAYEWLSAVLFAGLHSAFGAAGLVVLRVIVGLGCLALLYLSLAPAVRNSVAVLPLLILVDYLLCFRTLVRPHLFSLLMVAAICFAVERWRRSRRLRDLVWLVPLHALWANLHGAYLFGAVLLSGLAVVMGALAAFPRLGGGDAADRSRPADAVQLAGVALACLLASLANPYGAEALELSLRLSESSAFIKEHIWEWQSPFSTGPGKLWFGVYCLLLALLWGSVASRFRERPWLDLAIAALVTYQSARANRFVPYLAIFAFPIIARCVYQWSIDNDRWRSHSLRRAVGVVALLFMVSTSFGPAAAWSPRSIRGLGWGYGERVPLEEVEYMRRRALRGVVYSEYIDGAPIIYFLHPEVRPVMDARIDIYGPRLFGEYKLSLVSPEALLAYLERHGVDLVLLSKWEGNRSLVNGLVQSADWKLEKEFASRVLFARR